MGNESQVEFCNYEIVIKNNLRFIVASKYIETTQSSNQAATQHYSSYRRNLADSNINIEEINETRKLPSTTIGTRDKMLAIKFNKK